MTALPIALLGTLLAAPAAAGALPDPAPFDAVLAARARDGGFDYRGATGQDRKRLGAYLANVRDARPAAMSADEKKAFYVNAYNAMAIDVVLERYPVKSIMDVPGAFREIRRRIGGEDLSLDDVENRLRSLGDARFHFAIVCASESCPSLAPRAYTARTISTELERQARSFVNDRRHNVIDRQNEKAALSKIFEWNRREFEAEAGTVAKYVARFVSDPATARWLASGTRQPTFLEYDWRLNQR